MPDTQLIPRAGPESEGYDDSTLLLSADALHLPHITELCGGSAGMPPTICLLEL